MFRQAERIFPLFSSDLKCRLAPLARTAYEALCMKRWGSFRFLPVLAVMGASLACDALKKGDDPNKGPDEQQPQVLETKVEVRRPPAKKPWNEGRFRGQAELSLVSLVDEGEVKKESAKAKASAAENVKAGEPFTLSLDVELSAEGVTGSGRARGETLVVSGTVDASAVRLTLGGETVHGTFVGHGDEKTSTFQGVVRFSRTEMHEGKVSREAYAGELVLAGSE